MKQRDDLDNFYNNFMQTIETEEKRDQFVKYFYNSFLAGDTVIYQKNIAEFKNFDKEWVDKLEIFVPSIDKIVKNPKSTLRYDEDIVAIEKAKKVTSASIRHLASNTHLIKDVDEDGNVIPKKILTQQAEVEYGIYENRFIMTLINRLSRFVGNRYEVIKSNFNSLQRNHINMKSVFTINDSEVDLDIDMVIKSNIEDNALQERNNNLFDRVTKIVKMINGFKNSQFMQELSGQKPVLPPIMKTNIILKNPDFRNAYNLWLFLDTYNALVYDIDVQEKDLDLDPDYIQNLNQLALLNYAVILFNQENRREIYSGKQMVQYERKATKIVRTNPKDIVRNPDSIVMEDNSVNEYFLDQNQKLFKKSLSDMLGDNISFEDALKKTMTQTLDITNSLYKSVFDINPDVQEDVLKNLERPTLHEELAEAKKKARIARTIRETKEKDLKESIKLEKEQLKVISNINSQLIKQKAAAKRLAREKAKRDKLAKEQKETQLENQQVQQDKQIINDSIQELNSIKQELESEKKQINEKLIEETNKELIAAEKAKARAERAEELRRIKQERKDAIQKEREFYKEQREKIRAKFKEMQQVIIENEKTNRELEIQQLKEKFNKIREQELEKIKAKMG